MSVFSRLCIAHIRTYKSTRYYLFSLIIVVKFDLQSNSLFYKLNLFYVLQASITLALITNVTIVDPGEQLSNAVKGIYSLLATVYQINSLEKRQPSYLSQSGISKASRASLSQPERPLESQPSEAQPIRGLEAAEPSFQKTNHP